MACAGRHFGSAALLVAPRLLGAAYALTGRSAAAEDFREQELESLESQAAEAVLENGPLTGPELRRVLGTTDRKAVVRAVARLQRRLVLTNAGAVEQTQGWRAIRQDLLARRWRHWLRHLPPESEARRELARAVLRGAADEVSAADVGGALGWRRKEAEAVLEDVAASARYEDGIRLFRV